MDTSPFLLVVVHEVINNKKAIKTSAIEGENLDRESAKLLEMLGEVFISLREYDIEIMAVREDAADPASCQRVAMRRAAVVARFLTDAATLLPERVQAVGFSDTQLLEMSGIEPVNGHVLISIKQENP